MAAILDELSQKNLINFYCMCNQHGRRIIVFWILRDWLQPTNELVLFLLPRVDLEIFSIYFPADF